MQVGGPYKGKNLEFDWAEKRWDDPLTGQEVVCLSPKKNQPHFRLNYFRYNMFTDDGKYAVFVGAEDLVEGLGTKNRIWARDLENGELRDLGPLPDPPESHLEWFTVLGGALSMYAVGSHNHCVYVMDPSDPEAWAVLRINIDTGERDRIVPSERCANMDVNSSADGRHIYYTTPHGRYDLEGRQELLRLDLESCKVEHLFDNTGEERLWFMDHPNPNPANTNLVMCQCQDPEVHHYKARPSIRVRDLAAGKFLDLFHRPPHYMNGHHEHWNCLGNRIYTHDWVWLKMHWINRIDLEKGENAWFPTVPNVGYSHHALAAPDESFIIGEGYEFDYFSMPPDIRMKLYEHLEAGDRLTKWFFHYLSGDYTCPGETIYMHELPEETIMKNDDVWHDFNENYTKDMEPFHRLLRDNRELTVEVTPVCKFRTLFRSEKMLGYRLEASAKVTPDSRWAVFQSSSEDNLFEVWAARIPGRT